MHAHLHFGMAESGKWSYIAIIGLGQGAGCMLSAHHETLRRVCMMPVVDGFGLALDVSGLSN